MTLMNKNLHLRALHKLSPALPRLPTSAKRKSVFLDKGQSCTSLAVSGFFCEVFNSKQLGLRWAHIHHSSTEHLLNRTCSVITSKQNTKLPDVTRVDNPQELDVGRLEIGV